MSSPALCIRRVAGVGSGEGFNLKSFDEKTLERFRNVDCEEVIHILCDYFKEDTSFRPTKNSITRRWNVRVANKDMEILTTKAKWYDTRKNIGGGGAIDLAMHLMEIDFVTAVKLLQKKLP